MTWLPPLLVAIPLLAAALIAAGDHMLPQRLEQAMGIAAAAATTALAVTLALEARRHTVITWFGGWRPRGGVALGVDFTADQVGAAMCVVIALVVLLALVYSVTYMRESARTFDALMLAALGAMCGFAMAGDIFNMFVWIELAGVSAYALTGFAVEQIGPTQGAINFAILNSVGSYLFAIGIALLYAQTGALNLAQIGETLARQHHAGGPEIVALTLVVAGLLTKGACVPFHLWAADAYAAAPAPVCAMFGGVMTDLGLIGVARLYWTVFDAPFGAHAPAVGDLLLWVGVATALLGGVMALLQRHLKRMIAYSVVSHIGAMLAGIGLLSSKGLAGTATMFVAHALLTAGLFMVAGSVLATAGSIDELVLVRRPLRSRSLAAIWAAGVVGITGVPYLGVYLGHGLIDEAATESGRVWLPPLLWLASALVAAALLRAGARIFLGAGSLGAPLLGQELQEEPIVRDVRRGLLAGTAALTVAVGLAVSLAPGLEQRAMAAADGFRDRSSYAGLVLHGVRPAPAAPLPYALAHTTVETLLYGGGSLVLAAALALTGLYWRLAPLRARAAGRPFLHGPVRVLKELHSGVVGDYVTWLVVGTAVYGGVWALTLR